MSAALNTFANLLRHLILCGGGDLAPAWGPLILASRYRAADEAGAWCGEFAVLRSTGGHKGATGVEIDEPDRWSLPLDAASPWAARLAMIAAWMLGRRYIIGASVEVEDDYHLLMLSVSVRAHLGGNNGADPMFMRGHVSHTLTWGTGDGTGDDANKDLPTLPAHLAAHPPVVALVLALYDVPEIRARVDAVRP